jgi:hypothetical protein
MSAATHPSPGSDARVMAQSGLDSTESAGESANADTCHLLATVGILRALRIYVVTAKRGNYDLVDGYSSDPGCRIRGCIKAPRCRSIKKGRQRRMSG